MLIAEFEEFIFDLSYNSIAHSFAQIAASSVLSIVNEISDDTYISLITIDDQLTIFDFTKTNRTTYPELEPEILKDELTTHVCKLKDESGCCKNRFISVLKEIQNIKIDKQPELRVFEKNSFSYSAIKKFQFRQK